MSSVRIALEFDTEGGTTYGDLRRFVELTETVPDYYPVTFETDPQSTDERIVGIWETGRKYGKEDQWPATSQQ